MAKVQDRLGLSRARARSSLVSAIASVVDQIFGKVELKNKQL
ncbi:MAG: hypothetical protein ACFB5Z_15235 [Elainellaceae cyanobacterium]